MSPRQLSVLAAVVIALGGAVAIAKPSFLRLPSIAQAPTTAPSADGPGWLKEVNLSADQVQKMRVIRRQYKDKMGRQKQAMRQAQRELRTLMAGTAPESQLREKYNQVKTLRQQFAATQFESMLATRAVLTPDQRRKFGEHMLEQRHKLKDRMTDDRVPERTSPQPN